MSKERPYRITIDDLPKGLPFTLPKGYFTEFGQNLEARKAIESFEVEEPNFKRELPFQVPEEYFNQLHKDILQRSTIEKVREPELPKELPHQVPEGYFDELHDVILAKASSQASDKTWTVPEGYFDQLHDSIQQKVIGAKDTVVIPLYKRPVIQWGSLTAIAAAITLLLLFNPSATSEENCDALACLDLSTAEYSDYLENEVVYDEELSEAYEIIEAAENSSDKLEFLIIGKEEVLEEISPAQLEAPRNEEKINKSEQLDAIEEEDFSGSESLELLEEIEFTEDDFEDLDFEVDFL